ncbi:MAG: hypothetical protein AB7E73_17070 [Burkholderiales bacterium]
MRFDGAPENKSTWGISCGTEENLGIVEYFQKDNTACPIRLSCALAEILVQAICAFFYKLDSYTLAALMVQQEKLTENFRIPNT